MRSMSYIGLSEKYLCPGIFGGPIWTWPLIYKIYSRSLYTIWPYTLCKWSMSQLESKEETICPGQESYIWFCYDLNLRHRNMIQGHCTSFTKRHSVSEVWARLDQMVRRYALDKEFSYNSAMTLTLDLETRFKITVHPLHKGTLWVKYESDWAKGREDMLRTRDLGQTNGRMDGRTVWSLQGTRRVGPL